MTVCIAALCRWNYVRPDQPEDWGTVVIAASDRMITFGDVQYEPNQTKAGHIPPTNMLLISGDYALHSEAIRSTFPELRGRKDLKPFDAALIYGRALQAIKRRHAEDLYLTPLGLNTDMLHASEISNELTSALVNQMQGYQGEEVEALMIGMDEGGGSIYHIDTRGTVTCADDVGFAAIGSGAWHARSQLMQGGYYNNALYFPALAAIFAAKKAADVSPGVGSATDIHIVFRDNIEKLEPETFKKLHEVYDEYVAERRKLAANAVKSLTDFVIEKGKSKNGEQESEQGKEQPGTDAKSDGRPSEDAAEAARSDEDRKGDDQEAAE